MPLSRLENFLINTDGNILYVNPSDLDATDSFDNKGNSLTRPFKTIQRALLEAARFAYQSGQNNDRFDRTTILLYPGEHIVDNRPGLSIAEDSGVKYYDVTGSVESTSATYLDLSNSTIFDLNNSDNILAKFNSVHGGVIVPKGTSIVGLDLRKTKVRPLYVPNPDVDDSNIARSAIFRVTGGCYFWQFSIFDANQAVYYSKNFNEKRNPAISHHKLTCFEYADGLNKEDLTGTSDLQQYYYKLMNAYGANTGNRTIPNFPTFKDFEPNTSEFKIVGDLRSDDNTIQSLTSSGTLATVTTVNAHGLTVDDPVRIAGISSTLYEGSYRVSGISSERQFSYVLLDDANDDVINPTSSSKVVIEADNVTGASPYVFNCSLRSVYGMCGMHCDGSKATGFKSMVVAQFTGIGLQKDDNAFVIYNKTTGDYDTSATVGSGVKKPLYINQDATYRTRYKNYHIKATNDAVIQAVSTFAIGFANHFVSESGGEQSITNSNSNFGAKALISHGFRKNSFDRDDTGYVTHIVPPKDIENTEINVIWRLLDPSLMAQNIGAGGTSKLYIEGATDKDNPPNNITNGFRVGSKKGEKVYLDTLAGGANVTYESPILMTAPSGEGPSAEKRFNVARTATHTNNITSNQLTLVGTHNFFTGESVRVYSDDGRVPDGLENGDLYYVVSTGASTIKLATTFNNALAGTPVVTISNQKGGVLSIVSRVTDKLPGEFGHPIQWDTGKSNWYITGTDTTTTNSIYQGIVGFSTDIASNNSSLYVRRVPETRALSDRIYKLRYVIPSSYTDTIAKKPEKNYVLQESKTVGEESTIQNVISNRNPRIISGISTDTANAYQANVVSEIPHGLSIGDRVRIKNVKSSTNTTGADDEGYNGYYYVTKVTSTKGFSYISSNLGGTFDNNLRNLRSAGGQGSSLPAFERNEYDTTYTIQEVETLQDYVSGSQDGIYYLTCLLGNVKPTVSEYSNLKFKQNITQLYPTVDKDNATNDPQQSVTAASNSLIGKVVVNDPLNSITKETAINYLRDNRVGYAVTFAESKHSGITTVFSDINHSLNSVTNVSITAQGAGYSPSAGVGTEYYNVNLVGTNIVGDSATANVIVSTAGTISAVQIVDGGSAFGIGNTMVVSVPGLTGVTANAIVEVTGISNNIGDVVQVMGVGTVDDRNNGYDGAYKITSIPSAKSITYTNVPAGQTTGSNVGIYTGPVGVTTGIFFVTDEAVGFSEIVGVANTSVSGIVTVTTSKAHGLSVGNRIQIAGLVGTAATVYNGYNFIVKEKVGLTTFTFNSTIGIPTTGETGAEVYKLGFQSYGQSDSLELENISENLIPLTSGISTTMSAGINTANTNTTLSLSSYVGMSTGDFLQVDNEVMRIKSKSLANGNDVTVIRGVLGTKSVAHENGSVVRNIKVVPSETHRFSSVRASGHTFEYVGYGPGNYSTALPQKQTRALTAEEELLSNSKEENGGVVFYSGMNDRGDFFTGERATARENFLGELTDDSSTATFDDVYIRNTLRVGGGPNRNLPSEFSGPVNFTNKLTSTSLEGIEALKIAIKGTALNNPYFVVGPEANPSFVINKASQFVGIKTATPAYELDVNGSIRANIYENFKLSDLPIGVDEEVTFGRNKVLKVNNDGTGYELVDPHELDAYRLRSYNISNDGSIYAGMGSIVDSKLVISGISTAKFNVGERVKMFGVTKSSDSVTVPDPVVGNTVKITQVPTTGFDTTMTYYYWQAQYHYRNGKVGISSQISPTGNYSGGGTAPRAGVANTTLDNFNDLNHNVLNLSRSDANHGLLIYRQNYTGSGTASNADRGQAKLIAVLGQKELGSDTANISWKDYGVYEQTEWSAKGTVNEFVGFHTSTVATNQIHFPCIGTEGQRRGWDIDSVTAIGSSSITVSGNYLLNGVVGFGTTAVVKVVHENTKALTEAIADTVASGGNYLDLPSGTYLSNQIVIPTNFTLTGEGKNTFLKQQYYATDQTDQGSSGGTSLPFDGTFVGIGTTLGKDVTISNLTIDGNSSNNLTFVQDVDNYLVYMRYIDSALFKDIEIRNSPGSGLFLRDSNRVSVENSTFVDGGQTDRFPFQPLDAQNSTVIRINDNLFENYPGPVDVSVTEVVSTGGNIIRNCGSGLESYATGKITTQNNIILGPSDEWIPSPDIYDSDWDSINMTIKAGQSFEGPELLYLEDGEPKNISSSKVSIVAGIGTMIGLYSTTTATTLGSKFINFNVLTQDTEADGTGRDNGYIQLNMNATDTATLAGSATSALGYDIIGTGFLDQPAGFGTYVGISTGFWANNDTEPAVGTACTQYIVTLTTPSQFSGITTGDIVKLPGHQMSPNISSTELTVQKKWDVNSITKRVVLTTPNPPNSYTSISNGVDKGYISIRKVFTIAKGRVGVE